jgi:hypothetical protein
MPDETEEKIIAIRLRREDRVRLAALRRDIESRMPREISVTMTDLVRSAIASAASALPAGVVGEVESQFVFLDKAKPKRKRGRPPKPKVEPAP